MSRSRGFFADFASSKAGIVPGICVREPGQPTATSRCAWTASDASNGQPPSPVSPSVPWPQRGSEITTAITHLRNVLGDQTYESLARKAETMTAAATVTYAYDQIDQANRTEDCLEIVMSHLCRYRLLLLQDLQSSEERASANPKH